MSYCWGPFTSKPNILILMTDQERTTQYFPDSWVESELPNLTNLKNTGLSFKNGFIATTPCTPSRGTIFSGKYQYDTGIYDNTGYIEDPSDFTTLGTMMQSLGYDVAYKGKWHLSGTYTPDGADKDFSSMAKEKSPACDDLTSETSTMEDLGMPGWTPPDMGTAVGMSSATDSTTFQYTLGGGSWDAVDDSRLPNDNRIVDVSPLCEESNAVDFLTNDWDRTKPFFLVVSMVNPHDIFVYPNSYSTVGYDETNWTGDAYSDFVLPPSFNYSLDGKPGIQETQTYQNITTLKGMDTLGYFKFYAYLHTLVDSLCGSVTNTLESLEIIDNTIIVRMADHGEMGMSQGGMIQKGCNMYQEDINVPIIFNNSQLSDFWSNSDITTPATSAEPVSTIDLAPTLTRIAGASDADIENWGLLGTDFSDTLLNPTTTPTQGSVLFTYWGKSHPATSVSEGEDGTLKVISKGATKVEALECDESDCLRVQAATDSDNPSNLCAIITEEWKYAVYFDYNDDGGVDATTTQYEMYDRVNDTTEETNLLYNPSDSDKDQAETLFTELNSLLDAKGWIVDSGGEGSILVNWDTISFYRDWVSTSISKKKN